ASKLLGAKKAQLLCYKTSGDVTGDYSSVVGYASISFTK
ncbi:AmmeMemoRadiSam system protein B, partial [Candidatus Bathyarchaeota archaeon]|nr:AmmeMemoRadiSam system protein B [Candidatus Bathyarchaeota archaeon]